MTFNQRYVSDLYLKQYAFSNCGQPYSAQLGYQLNDCSTWNNVVWVYLSSIAITMDENVSINQTICGVRGVTIVAQGGLCGGATSTYGTYEIIPYTPQNYNLNSVLNSIGIGSYKAQLTIGNLYGGFNVSNNISFDINNNAGVIFSLKDRINYTNLTNFQVYVYSNGNLINYSATNNNESVFYGVAGQTYYYNVTKTNFETTGGNFVMPAQFTISNITVLSYNVPSIVIRAFTEAAIPIQLQNMTARVFGTMSFFNTYYTNNYTLFINQLPFDTYRIEVESPGYVNRSYIINVNSNNNFPLDAYLAQITNTQTFLFLIKDGLDQAVPNAQLSLSFMDSNGAQHVLSNQVADGIGQVTANLIYGNTYSWIVSSAAFGTSTNTIQATTSPITLRLLSAAPNLGRNIAGYYYIARLLEPVNRTYQLNTPFNISTLFYSNQSLLQNVRMVISGINLDQCIIGNYDGQNCTINASGNAVTQTLFLRINPGNNSVIAVNTYVDIAGYTPNQKNYFLLTSNQDKYFIFKPLQNSFQKSGFAPETMLFIALLISIIVGITFVQIGFPPYISGILSFAVFLTFGFFIVPMTGWTITAMAIGFLLLVLLVIFSSGL
jgi:hypothetical protein